MTLLIPPLKREEYIPLPPILVLFDIYNTIYIYAFVLM